MRFLFSLIGKSQAADDLNEAFLPSYTAELVAQSQGAVQAVGAMGDEMQTAMLPGLAVQLGMSEEQVQAFIGENFPATAAALDTMPDAMGRFEAMVGVFDAQLANYDTIKDTALTPIAWMIVIGGALIFVLGIWAPRRTAGADRSGNPRLRSAERCWQRAESTGTEERRRAMLAAARLPFAVPAPG